MAFQKGKSGNPGGRRKDKIVTQELILALNEMDGDANNLRHIIDALVVKAKSGDVPAFNAIADRVDGKPAQESTLTIDDKRNATDWTRAELVAFLNDAKDGGAGASEADGCAVEPDRVH